MKQNHVLTALVGIAALAIAVSANAQQGGLSALKGHNSKAPIDLAADHAEAQDRADRAIFSGNVVVKQEELTLRTARLTLAYANNGGIDINRIDASGGVVITSPSETARGDFGSYDLNAGLITVVGNVRLERNGSFLNGARLTIDTNTGRATMDGGPAGNGGRVTGRFTVPQKRS
nr:LptA/OstA family protein [uncultured Sphingomonas sp.]